MHRLSWTYRQQVKLDEAEATITDLLDMYGETFGPGNEDSYNMLIELSRVRLRSGKLTAALQSLKKAAIVARKNTDDAQRHVQSSIGDSATK